MNNQKKELRRPSGDPEHGKKGKKHLIMDESHHSSQELKKKKIRQLPRP